MWLITSPFTDDEIKGYMLTNNGNGQRVPKILPFLDLQMPFPLTHDPALG